MKIDIPKVVVPVDLGGYAPELQGKFLQVWVNPPLKTLRDHAEILASDYQKLLAWYADLWSQSAELATHWVTDELTQLEQDDPAFLSWMISQTWQAIIEHRGNKKKS
jgi:hypothetical protein